MRTTNKFRMSVVALGVLATFGWQQAMAADAVTTGATVSVNILTGAGSVTGGAAADSLNTTGITNTSVGNATGNTSITGATNAITGTTSINASVNSATNLNTGTSTGAVTIGNSANTTNLNSATNNIGVNAFTTANNIGTNAANISTNNIGSINAGTAVTATGGNSVMSVVNGTANLHSGLGTSSNTTLGGGATASGGGYTAYSAVQTVLPATTINNQLNGAQYVNKINGNTMIDGNLYINGTLDYVASTSANTTVVGATAATSNLSGATQATTGGTAIVMKGATGSQTVVDANGKLVNTSVTNVATQSTAALTLTNGLGNTHGLVVTESQATLSGGTRSSSLTMSDNGATFSDSASGGPVQVHGVNDGSSDFDAVNVRQFAGAIAGVAAMSNIPGVDTNKNASFGFGLGSYMSKTALAVGGSMRISQNGVIKASLAGGSKGAKTSFGVGAGWSW